VAVHPDFRQLGVYTKIRPPRHKMAVASGMKMNYAVSSHPIILGSWRRRRHSTFPKRVKNLVRIRDVNQQLKAMPMKNELLMKLGFSTLKTVNSVKNLFRDRPQRDQHLHISDVERFDSRINMFCEQILDEYKFILFRNQECLNWRYCDPRAGPFTVRQVEDDVGRILGYSVTAINNCLKEYPIGFLVDLLTLQDRKAVADALISDAVKFFDNKNVNIVNCQVVEGHRNEKVLNRFGFLDTRMDLELFYDSYGEVDEVAKLVQYPGDTVHFSYGDIDSLPTQVPDSASR
jgi:hypothetical protein